MGFYFMNSLIVCNTYLYKRAGTAFTNCFKICPKLLIFKFKVWLSILHLYRYTYYRGLNSAQNFKSQLCYYHKYYKINEERPTSQLSDGIQTDLQTLQVYGRLETVARDKERIQCLKCSQKERSQLINIT